MISTTSDHDRKYFRLFKNIKKLFKSVLFCFNRFSSPTNYLISMSNINVPDPDYPEVIGLKMCRVTKNNRSYQRNDGGTQKLYKYDDTISQAVSKLDALIKAKSTYFQNDYLCTIKEALFNIMYYRPNMVYEKRTSNLFSHPNGQIQTRKLRYILNQLV